MKQCMKKIGPKQYQITSWHEKGKREYRISSEETAIYYRDKNVPDMEWQRW